MHVCVRCVPSGLQCINTSTLHYSYFIFRWSHPHTHSCTLTPSCSHHTHAHTCSHSDRRAYTHTRSSSSLMCFICLFSVHVSSSNSDLLSVEKSLLQNTTLTTCFQLSMCDHHLSKWCTSAAERLQILFTLIYHICADPLPPVPNIESFSLINRQPACLLPC